MANWRLTGSRCPLDERELRLSVCQPCRFFRGASRPPGEPWKMLCNYPRNGTEVYFDPVPDAFREAFED